MFSLSVSNKNTSFVFVFSVAVFIFVYTIISVKFRKRFPLIENFRFGFQPKARPAFDVKISDVAVALSPLLFGHFLVSCDGEGSRDPGASAEGSTHQSAAVRHERAGRRPCLCRESFTAWHHRHYRRSQRRSGGVANSPLREGGRRGTCPFH